MKSFSLFLLIFSTTILFAQKKDTIFLKREINNGQYPSYHAIYIDTTAQKRNILTDFSFNTFDSTSYYEELLHLKPLKKNNNLQSHTLPSQWIVLYKLKGKYYLYCPSDMGHHFKFEINDSTTIDYTMEGPLPSKISSINFPSHNKIIINRLNSWQIDRVEINIIDTQRGIAVFTFANSKHQKDNFRYLMVDKQKAYVFSTIVNYCSTNKEEEFEFDKID